MCFYRISGVLHVEDVQNKMTAAMLKINQQTGNQREKCFDCLITDTDSSPELRHMNHSGSFLSMLFPTIFFSAMS